MELEWDEEKRLWNLAERRLDFADAVLIDFASATTIEDSRDDYGEPRFLTYGLIDARLHVLCWTPRGGAMRIISFRKANDREQKAYAPPPGSPVAPH